MNGASVMGGATTKRVTRSEFMLIHEINCSVGYCFFNRSPFRRIFKKKEIENNKRVNKQQEGRIENLMVDLEEFNGPKTQFYKYYRRLQFQKLNFISITEDYR